MPDGTQELELPVENQLSSWNYFPTTIYTIERLDFLKVVQEVSDERLEEKKSKDNLDPIYPVMMTDNLFTDDRISKFCDYVGATAWNILEAQGYAMTNMVTTFTEMWTQEHHKHSLMEQHVHGFGAQLVGFYFLETPENCSNLVFHDPRAGKVQVNLPEANVNMATPASQMINFTPKPGMMIFANSWLAHSFTRHSADKPIKFVHFNLTVQQAPQTCAMPAAEII
jgi:uncharacterized protein (TIGR02466 family)